ncbi:MAG: serine hydrolase [Pyrinomonadaceae bacterium]
MRKTSSAARVFLLLVLSVGATFAQTAQQRNVDIFDKYAESARTAWEVPGMSIGIVKDGNVLLSKGYGVRELGKSDPVNAQTLFGAMSTTKAMVAAAMGMLVDEGKVSWDDKVIKHLPSFRVADPYVTNEMKVRDLFTHNTGIGNADFLWAWTPELSSDEIVARMRFAPQAYSFRGGYTYQNIMYLVAGQVIEKASGMKWERFMDERLFAPLGMKDTFPNYALSKAHANRSVAHYEIDGKIVPIPEMNADPIAPAGAVWSTSDDIAKWLKFMLGETSVNGKELLKAATLAEILRPQTVIPAGQFYPTTRITKPHWTTYGLGWFQHDYRGEMVNFHTGSLAGRTAIIGLIPDKKLGIYIFGNVDHAEVRHALMYKAFDLFAFDDSNGRDWSSEFKALYDGIAAEGKKQEAAVKAMRIQNTRPSLALEAYIGRYSDPLYGSMEVSAADGKLRLTVNKGLSARLDHWQFDTFQAVWDKRWWGEDLMSFQINPITGKVASLTLAGAVLKREPEAKK